MATAAEILEAATVTYRGDDWGDPPLWTVELPDGSTIDVGAVDETDALAKVFPIVDEQATGRKTHVARVQALLADSDKWAARATEEGVPMTAERVAYRQELRALLAKVETAADPGAIELPEPAEAARLNKPA